MHATLACMPHVILLKKAMNAGAIWPEAPCIRGDCLAMHCESVMQHSDAAPYTLMLPVSPHGVTARLVL